MSGARGWLALLALGSAAFTLLGSLVPFEYEAPPPGEAPWLFVRMMRERLRPHSKSDTLANVMLGVPLGFALLGMLCADRGMTRTRTAILGLAVLPACAAFAGAVEFAQLFARGRFCAGSDVVAQSLGAAIGIALWVSAGPWLTEQARKTATGAAPAARLLVAYVLLLGFIQALPLDLSASPADAYRKFRDGGVNPVPLRELRDTTDNPAYGQVAKWLKLAGLYLPVGLLAGRIPGRFWEVGNVRRVVLAAVGLALAFELGQVFVKSRTSSATDVVVGAGGAVFGWLIAWGFHDRMNPPRQVMLGMGWWGLLVWVSWVPHNVALVVPFDWTPGMPLGSGNPLLALEEMLTKVVLFGLGGAVVAASDFITRVGRTELAVATVLGLLAGAILEFGQTRFGGTPGVTDVILAGLGAFCGAWVTGRVRTARE